MKQEHTWRQPLLFGVEESRSKRALNFFLDLSLREGSKELAVKFFKEVRLMLEPAVLHLCKPIGQFLLAPGVHCFLFELIKANYLERKS